MEMECQAVPHLTRMLRAMNGLQRHRGPDGEGMWRHPDGCVGFGHRRLSVIDLDGGHQPMRDSTGNWVTFNGEIYNYRELRAELGPDLFQTESDTEVILHAYRKWGVDCVTRFRGMFAFALWDEERRQLFCARDRFGIKPLYYAIADNVLYIASEIKGLLPFVPEIETNLEAFKEYLTFQFCLAGKTLFRDIHELMPGHVLIAGRGMLETRRYWEVYYELDWDHTGKYFEERIRALIEDSVALHLRSDVPVGAYVSGGMDSSIVASLAGLSGGQSMAGFTGKFAAGPTYDESRYARELASWRGFPLHELEMTEHDFVAHIEKILYHLDQPVAGPGSFPQYMVSSLAGRHRKVVLGGQGGDEIFGGYARYLIAYFEQCIKAAIDGTAHNGNFIVTYESIIPNLSLLREYKPLLQEFWRKGLFEDLDRRYFRLVNRARDLDDEVNWAAIERYSPFEAFNQIFRGSNVRKESYFDCMTHFDFKTLLPALLHVEDRMSMAHGVESRVPFLDHPLVEFVATIPSNVKFMNGRLKHVLKNAMADMIPPAILNRTDKMGFPVPLHEWLKQDGIVQEFVRDVFSSQRALRRELIDNAKVLETLEGEARYGRKIWGLLSLELWQQAFHDRACAFRQLANVEVLQ
jgi:asparagine synthase (glutamine-hydrolysing)